MKTFKQFREVYDPEIQGRSQIKKGGDGGRIRPDRKKTEPEKRRMKAAGGGKMVPAKDYKPRKDIGQQRQKSQTEQQPTKERGSAQVKQSYADKVKAERKKAAQARAAAKKSGGEVKKDTTSSKDKEKAASKLLTKKTTKTVSPNYKPAKASGKTRAERDKQKNEADKYLKGVFKDQETAKYKKETGQNPDAKGRTKILGRVNKRMRESVDDIIEYTDPEHSSTYGTGSQPQSGTVGGTTAKFQKRPKTGLGNLAKNAGQSIKNAGKNALSKQKPKDGKGLGKERAGSQPTAQKGDSAVNKVRGAIGAAKDRKRLGSRPGIGVAQRPDLASGPKPKAISPGGSSIQKRQTSKPATQSGIKPVRVTVLGPKRAGYIGSGDKKKLPAAKKQLPGK